MSRMLYNLDADRTELHNLAAEHPDSVASMAGQYETWARRTRVVVVDDAPRTSGTARQQKKAKAGAKKKRP